MEIPLYAKLNKYRASGTALRRVTNGRSKRNCWQRGNGSYSMRGELRHGISLNKKYLNRKVRHSGREALKRGDYKRICRTLHMVEFS